jgi:small subunit ribosomal protein S21
VRRARKAARKQAQREGLLPMPKKKLEVARPRTRA